jgi:hypothetical protein
MTTAHTRVMFFLFLLRFFFATIKNLYKCCQPTTYLCSILQRPELAFLLPSPGNITALPGRPILPTAAGWAA